DYEKLGYKTGELAVKVLNGEEISNIPVTMLDETQIIVNEDTLESLSLKKIDDKNIIYIKTEKN
ncbi:MAG TPA: ABC transporter substrate-binding protein, partial [Clostridium sp.]|nr:ABC transporter substrate-binding protein [Clostridium sp.]